MRTLHKGIVTIGTALLGAALVMGSLQSAARADGVLPLRPGRYVVGSSPCSEDATSTSMRYLGNVLGTGHEEEHIRKVVRRGNRYDMVVLAIGDGGMGGDLRQVRHETFVITKATSFRQVGGSTFRWCDAIR